MTTTFRTCVVPTTMLVAAALCVSYSSASNERQAPGRMLSRKELRSAIGRECSNCKTEAIDCKYTNQQCMCNSTFSGSQPVTPILDGTSGTSTAISRCHEHALFPAGVCETLATQVLCSRRYHCNCEAYQNYKSCQNGACAGGAFVGIFDWCSNCTNGLEMPEYVERYNDVVCQSCGE